MHVIVDNFLNYVCIYARRKKLNSFVKHFNVFLAEAH